MMDADDQQPEARAADRVSEAAVDYRVIEGDTARAEVWAKLDAVLARYRERGVDLYFRADAAFAKPEVYELLEQEGIHYAIRLPANQVLQRRIEHLLTRPLGRMVVKGTRANSIHASALSSST
jgi:hypothetical protein